MKTVQHTCESIRITAVMLEYTESNVIEGVLFAIDFEGVFDSIEHPFIFAALQTLVMLKVVL